MPLRPSQDPDPAWEEVAARWEFLADTLRAGARTPGGGPSEDQAYRILQATHTLAVAGYEAAERLVDAFGEREDVGDALEEVRTAWAELRDRSQEVVDG